jgi:hypothetical protein
VVLGLVVCGPLTAAVPTRPVSQLKPGMKGIGKTVIRGVEIANFDFEIVDVLKSDGFNNDLILIKVSGPVIEAAGGICAGMSGSPLYIENDLIGAVAMTTPNSDTHFGYATPIADMLKVFAPTPLGPTKHTALLDGLPVRTPVLACGLRDRALEMVAALLRRHGHNLVQAQPTPVNPVPPGAPKPAQDLPPGSAVAASLTTGDVVLTALGTVTWRDADRVLAFGHPFLRRGQTSLYMHPAYIYGVVPSRELSFKIGAPAGPPLGSFTVDRQGGIGGTIGKPAQSFAVDVRVRDENLARERTLKVEVIRDPELAPILTAVCVVQAMQEVMDRTGGGSATIGWSLQADGLGREVSRDDMVYSAGDVTGEAAAGPLFVLDALLRNDFGALTPRALKINITVSDERRTARLTGLRCDATKLKPGDTLKLTATLQPYRGQPYTRELTLLVPRSTPAGRFVLDVHGRARSANGPLTQAALMVNGLPAPTSLPELLRALASTQRGDTLLAELLAPEVAAAREQAVQKMAELPKPDLFGEEAPSLPILDLPAGVATAALVRAETRLDKVVLGRLRETVTVVAAP